MKRMMMASAAVLCAVQAAPAQAATAYRLGAIVVQVQKTAYVRAGRSDHGGRRCHAAKPRYRRDATDQSGFAAFLRDAHAETSEDPFGGSCYYFAQFLSWLA